MLMPMNLSGPWHEFQTKTYDTCEHLGSRGRQNHRKSRWGVLLLFVVGVFGAYLRLLRPKDCGDYQPKETDMDMERYSHSLRARAVSFGFGIS